MPLLDSSMQPGRVSSIVAQEQLEGESTSGGGSLERRLHRALYLSLQLARGRPVGGFMRRLREWDGLDVRTYRAAAERRLAGMLDYARENVPLYSSEEWRRGSSGAGRGDIRSWPVLDRTRLVEDRAGLISRRWRPQLITRHSSASTGAPVKVAWNPVALAWSWAAEYHPMSWHDISIGARTLKIWGSGTPLENWILNRMFVPLHDLSAERFEEAYEYVVTRRPRIIWGTPSAVAQFARFVGNEHPGGAHPLVPYVKVGGEQVYAFQREEILRHLGARLIEAYGCTEMGPVAAECPQGSLHILGTNVHLEIFRDGEPVRAGEFGDIVATTLINRAMPLVRCRIGDSGRLSPDACGCGLPQPVLSELRGRSTDMLLSARGKPVHGTELGKALLEHGTSPPLSQVQQVLFEQVDERTWSVHVESSRAPELSVLERQLTHVVRTTFGDECEVRVSVVAKIEREESGKYRYYRVGTALRGGA